MSLLSYILQQLQRGKITPEELEEKVTEESAGKILIEYDSKTGDFHVLSDITDMSEDSVNVLSYLIFHISQGELENFIYESLKLWAGDDPEKRAFNEQLANQMQRLNTMVMTNMQPGEEAEPQKTGRVAVPASQVFNFKGMNQ